MRQLTKKQAIDFFNSGIWKSWNDEQIVKMQLFQQLICVDFSRFSEAMSNILDRPVYTHEFASSNYNNLVLEYLGEKEAPSFEEIIGMIPEGKRIIIGS